jgi:prepilin-type N-terminal cleavage/methylation domain-containing protein
MGTNPKKDGAMKRQQCLPASFRAGLSALVGARGNQGLSVRSVAGFTMIELIITIVILCALLGLAIPAFSNWVPNYRLRGAVRDIYSDFQYAKMTAVKDRAGCGVLFDRAGNLYRVVSSGPNRSFESTSGAVGGDDVVLRTVNFSEYGSGVAYGHGSATAAIDANFGDNVTFEEDGVVFDSRGMVFRPSGAASAGGYVYVQNNRNNTHAAGVWTSGVVVMRRWTGTAWQQ